MPHLRRLAIFAISITAGAGSCARPSNHSVAPSASARDTSLVGLLLRTLTDSSPYPVKIDPLRLPADMDTPAPLQARNDVHAQAFLRQVGRIVEVGLRSAEPGLRETCVTPMRGLLGDGSDLRGCPKNAYILAVLGTPRRGGAFRVSDSDSAKAREKIEQGEGYWSVRAILTFLGPRGRSHTLYDYVFKKSDESSGWTFMRRVPLFTVE
jgi:hypothetical protein